MTLSDLSPKFFAAGTSPASLAKLALAAPEDGSWPSTLRAPCRKRPEGSSVGKRGPGPSGSSSAPWPAVVGDAAQYPGAAASAFGLRGSSASGSGWGWGPGRAAPGRNPLAGAGVELLLFWLRASASGLEGSGLGHREGTTPCCAKAAGRRRGPCPPRSGRSPTSSAKAFALPWPNR